MRRAHLVLTALVLSTVLALTGCSGDSKSQASATPTAPARLDCSSLTIDTDSAALPQVGGDAAAPSLTWSGQGAPANLTVKTLTAGQGAEVTPASYVVSNYAGWRWGEQTVFDSSYARGEPLTLAAADFIDGWRCGLIGHHVGDRLVMAIPSELAYGDNPSNGAPAGPLVFVMDIVDVPTTASATMEGEADVAALGVTVSGELGAPATVSVNPGTAEPTEDKIVVLARGAGEPITAQDTVGANIARTTWDNSVFESTWDIGAPSRITVSAAPDLTGLVGVPVGSRVVMVQAAGTDANGTVVPARAYVIDIDTKLR